MVPVFGLPCMCFRRLLNVQLFDRGCTTALSGTLLTAIVYRYSFFICLGASASTSCDVIDDVGDYEIDSHSTGSGSEQISKSDSAINGELQPVATKPLGVGNPRRRKRRFASLPARDMQTRGAKVQKYRFEKRTHQKVLHVSPYEADMQSQCDVSPCQVMSYWNLHLYNPIGIARASRCTPRARIPLYCIVSVSYTHLTLPTKRIV